MRPHRPVIALLATLVAAALLVPAATAIAAPVTEQFIVPTRHGDIFLEVARPSEDFRGPVILTYSPYSALYDSGRTADAPEWNEQGYIRAFADLVGTGNSGGCYDYGGKRERETAYDVVEWIAKQKWSNGKIGMTGVSYEGTTAIAAAVERPPHLTTIVPIGAISRWYEYAYSGGIRYTLNNEWLGHQGPGAVADEGFDTPLAFDFGLAIPPPADPQNEKWAERVQSTITPCDEIEHTQRGYDDTPDYDKFWLERDYVKDAGSVRIPVLIAHNWGDWKVKQEEAINLYRALDSSKKVSLFMGTRWEGHGMPGGDFEKVRMQWLDHYLKGADNGADKLPQVTSQMSDFDGARDWYKGNWPKTRPIELVAQEGPRTSTDDYQWKLLPGKPTMFGLQQPTPAQFPSANINTEAHANHHCRQNHDWWCFETPTLKRDMRIFGEIKVQLYSTVQRKWITFTPSIVDVNPADHKDIGNQHVNTNPQGLVAVTRGWLDSRYRKSLSKQVEVTPGKPFSMTVVTKPQDYTFKKGHYIWLNVQTEINEWSLPKPYPGCDAPPDPTTSGQNCTQVRINWEEGKTRLILPVVNAPNDLMKLFDMGVHQHG